MTSPLLPLTMDITALYSVLHFVIAYTIKDPAKNQVLRKEKGLAKKKQEHGQIDCLKIVLDGGFGSDGMAVTSKCRHGKNEERTRMEERELLYFMKEQVGALLVAGGDVGLENIREDGSDFLVKKAELCHTRG